MISVNLFLKTAGYDEYEDFVNYVSAISPDPFRDWFPNGRKEYFDLPEGKEFVDEEILKVLSENNYKVKSYKDGIVTDISKNQDIRIGKALNKIKQKKLQQAKGELEVSEIEDEFDNYLVILSNSEFRNLGAKNKSLKIVISIDPHDIAKASYDRIWTSCLRLNGGIHKRETYCSILNGSIIAYLIESDDLEINNPLSRILIKRFSNSDGDSIAVMEPNVYGIQNKQFYDFVKNWLNEKQPNINSYMKSKMITKPPTRWNDDNNPIYFVDEDNLTTDLQEVVQISENYGINVGYKSLLEVISNIRNSSFSKKNEFLKILKKLAKDSYKFLKRNTDDDDGEEDKSGEEYFRNENRLYLEGIDNPNVYLDRLFDFLFKKSNIDTSEYDDLKDEFLDINEDINLLDARSDVGFYTEYEYSEQDRIDYAASINICYAIKKGEEFFNEFAEENSLNASINVSDLLFIADDNNISFNDKDFKLIDKFFGHFDFLREEMKESKNIEEYLKFLFTHHQEQIFRFLVNNKGQSVNGMDYRSFVIHKIFGKYVYEIINSVAPGFINKLFKECYEKDKNDPVFIDKVYNRLIAEHKFFNEVLKPIMTDNKFAIAAYNLGNFYEYIKNNENVDQYNESLVADNLLKEKFSKRNIARKNYTRNDLLFAIGIISKFQEIMSRNASFAAAIFLKNNHDLISKIYDLYNDMNVSASIIGSIIKIANNLDSLGHFDLSNEIDLLIEML